jgi:hypothetical protein
MARPKKLNKQPMTTMAVHESSVDWMRSLCPKDWSYAEFLDMLLESWVNNGRKFPK